MPPRLKVKHIAGGGAILLILTGITAICGWLFHWPEVLRLLPDGRYVPLDTAFCLILSGLALLYAAGDRTRSARALGFAVAALGAMYLTANLIHYPASIHSLLPGLTSAVVPILSLRGFGMSIPAAIMFVLLGIAILLLEKRKPGRYSLSLAALLGVAVGVFGVLGTLVSATGLYDDHLLTGLLLRMSLPAALCACISGISICALFWTRSQRTGQQFSETLASFTLLGFLLLFAGIGAAISSNADITRKTSRDVSATWREIKAIQDIVESVRKAETGQRGFLLTGDDTYLKVHDVGLSEIRNGFQDLQVLGYSGKMTQTLRDLTDRKQAELMRTISLQHNGQHEEAIALVRSGHGLVLMTQLDSEAAKLVRGLQSDLALRMDANQRSLRLMQTIVIASYTISFLLTVFGLTLVRAEIRRRAGVEAELRRSGRELEDKVFTRTYEISRQAEVLETEVARRKLTETALRETDVRLRIALGFAKVAVWTWRVAEDALMWSGPVEAVFGLSGAKLTSYAALRKMIHPDDRALAELQVSIAARERSDYASEFRIIRPDGEVRWIAGLGGGILDDNGQVREMAGVHFDISERKLAEQQLETSERHFRELAEAMPQIVWIAGASGDFEYYNDLWYEVTGLPKFTGGKEDRRKVLHPDDFERWDRCWAEAVARQQPMEIEYRFWDVRNNEYRWYLGRSRPVRDTDGTVTRWFGTCTDFHERKVAEMQLAASEQALRQREHQLAMIFEAGTIGDWTWDIAKDELRAHPTVWSLYGAAGRPESVSAKWMQARQHPLDAARVGREMDDALRGERPLDIEFRIVRPDGTIRWVSCRGVVVRDAQGVPIQTHGLNIDITERKTAELRMQESERQFRQQADAMPQIVWTTASDGGADYYNQRWYEYIGQPLEQTTAWGWTAVVHPDDLRECLNTLHSGVAGGTAFELECRLRRASDDAYRWHLVRSVPYRSPEGAILRWFGTSTDIHEQKTAKQHLEAEVLNRTSALQHSLQQLQVKEEQLQRSLVEKETLLKEVHHRVKNNLQVISSLLRMQANSLNDHEACEALKESQHRVLSMALIHERLYGSQQMDQIDFGEYAQALVSELFYSYSGYADQVISRFNLSRVFLNIDQAIPCGLILNELVTNALKYAYPKGTPGEVVIELKETPAGRVILSVSDSGIGLPQGFDWKASKSMGLPIVDILAKQIGGTLTVRSHQGSSFSVEFPRETKPERTASAA